MFKKRDKAKSKEVIIKAAIAVFAKNGYERATYKMISEVAGLNESLITRYFGGKKGLLVAAMDFIKKEFLDLLDTTELKQSFVEEAHSAGSLLATIYEKNINNFLTFFMLLPNELDECKEFASISENRAKFIFRFSGNRLKKFQDNGEIPLDVDLEGLYRRMVILMHSTLYFTFIVLKFPISEAEKLLHNHIDSFIKGLNSINS